MSYVLCLHVLHVSSTYHVRRTSPVESLTFISICICDSLVQVAAKSKIKTLKKSFLFNTKSTVLTHCVNCFFLFAPLKAHRHEVTICNYEATANPADHKVESIIPQTNFISWELRDGEKRRRLLRVVVTSFWPSQSQRWV